jgi:basic membrane lipoprotein Med (substrate-binding protein (PBP1-ABC) superfamily)
MNYYYVREGNKRVSVLKTAGAYSIEAEVRRIIPVRDRENKLNNIYYEFLDFNKKTGIFNIWFSEEGRFAKLNHLFDSYDPKLLPQMNKYEHFLANVYRPFRKLYHQHTGGKLDITTGDALLKYIDIYGIPQEISEWRDNKLIKKLSAEFEIVNHEEAVKLITDPVKPSGVKLINVIAKKVIKKKLKVGFIYAKKPKTSGWTNAHVDGCKHIEKVLKNKIKVYTKEDVPQDDNSYEAICELADNKLDAIFTTSPTYNMQTLKAALNYPKIKFFNCSQNDSFKNVRSYYGRIHEVKFLTGLIAGALTKNDLIGYVATYPISEVIGSINAFALGVNFVNPNAKVKIYWAYRWQHKAFSTAPATELTRDGADLISQEDLPVTNLRKKTYGLFSTKYSKRTDSYIPDKQYAIPVWHWGVFYEKILNNILNDSWKLFFEGNTATGRPVTFWWGINSGLVDIFYSTTHLPPETQKLVEFMRKMIIQDEYNIFAGPIADQTGKIHIPSGVIANRQKIVTMDNFVKNVIGEIPRLEDDQVSDPLTQKRRVK